MNISTILPTGYTGFAIHRKNLSSYEESTVLATCILNKIPYNVVSNAKEVKREQIPIGDIKFIQDVLGYKVRPNYYPIEYSGIMKRKVWETDKWPLGKKVFIKPSDEYKRFTGFVTNGGYKGKKRSPYICSEVIKIKNEWRYYSGSGMGGFWYAGEDEMKDAPIFSDIMGLSGCLDIGETVGGEIVLIEWQHAFSCGWYGKGIKDGEK